MHLLRRHLVLSVLRVAPSAQPPDTAAAVRIDGCAGGAWGGTRGGWWGVGGLLGATLPVLDDRQDLLGAQLPVVWHLVELWGLRVWGFVFRIEGVGITGGAA